MKINPDKVILPDVLFYLVCRKAGLNKKATWELYREWEDAVDQILSLLDGERVVVPKYNFTIDLDCFEIVIGWPGKPIEAANQKTAEEREENRKKFRRQQYLLGWLESVVKLNYNCGFKIVGDSVKALDALAEGFPILLEIAGKSYYCQVSGSNLYFQECLAK